MVGVDVHSGTLTAMSGCASAGQTAGGSMRPSQFDGVLAGQGVDPGDEGPVRFTAPAAPVTSTVRG